MCQCELNSREYDTSHVYNNQSACAGWVCTLNDDVVYRVTYKPSLINL